MSFHHGLAGLRELPRGTILSIGNFDGVHVGHRAIVSHMRSLRTGDAATAPLAVVTFEPHPLTVLRPQFAPPRLTPPAIKARLLASIGVEHLVTLPPSDEVLSLSAEQFWAILRDGTRPVHLVEGENFSFGKGRGGSIATLRSWTKGTGIEVHVVPHAMTVLSDQQLIEVSSSVARFLIVNGRMRDAAACLGAHYTLVGKVVHGQARGRTIGVPTANFEVDQLVPAEGVYSGRANVDGKPYAAGISIGTTPTFEGPARRQIEAHLLDYSGDLYGREIEVEVIDWIRDQQKFPTIELLKEQIDRDMKKVREQIR